jgi:ADP-heptose:LPS heptosyltransferase
LVVKLATIGDVLNITAALRALRQRYPDARIDVLTTAAGRTALMRSAFHDEVIVFDKTRFDRIGGSLSPGALLAGLRFARQLRGARYDTLVLLHHLITAWGTLKYAALALFSRAPIRVGLDNGRGWFLTHRALDWGFGRVNERRYWLDVVALLGATGDDDRPHFAPTEDDREAGQALVAPVLRRGGQPLVVIHPTTGAYAPSRQWPAERFAAVGDALAADGWDVVLTGVPGEREISAAVRAGMRAPATDLTGATSLGGLAALLRSCAVLIGNDTGSAHLAAAVGARSVTVFLPGDPVRWAHRGPRHRAVVADVPCAPCPHLVCPIDFRCAASVRPREVLAAARELTGRTA